MSPNMWGHKERGHTSNIGIVYGAGGMSPDMRLWGRRNVPGYASMG
jgi:hypothetical protein